MKMNVKEKLRQNKDIFKYLDSRNFDYYPKILQDDDEYEIITKKEFENYLNDFFDTCLTPTKENMKRAYHELDLERLLEKYPEYFNREDVKFFIDRFDVLDNIIEKTAAIRNK